MAAATQEAGGEDEVAGVGIEVAVLRAGVGLVVTALRFGKDQSAGSSLPVTRGTSARAGIARTKVSANQEA